MIEVSNLHYRYNAKLPPVLNGVSFKIEQGEFVALIGQNGAGKTTLLKQLNGLLKPTEGNVAVCGMNTKETKTSTLAGKIGFLFQNPDRQIFCDTVRAEIEYGLRRLLTNEKEIRNRVEEISTLFSLQGNLDKSPFMLSRGERQRIALASVLALKTDVLVLDEPTTGQDYQECMEIMKVIRALNEQGKTIVMVSHDMEVVGDFSKRVIILSDGKIGADGETGYILHQREQLSYARLRPPQIMELGLRLGGEFSGVNTVGEFYSTVEQTRG